MTAIPSATLLTAALLALAVNASAQGTPAGDATIGKALHEKDCVACHARRFDGDAAKMYLRSDRRVQTPKQLTAQVAYCNSQLATRYFPEEEAHVAAYLDLQYYKFGAAKGSKK
jgi:mono/diheme cytochrome c family protein